MPGKRQKNGLCHDSTTRDGAQCEDTHRAAAAEGDRPVGGQLYLPTGGLEVVLHSFQDSRSELLTRTGHEPILSLFGTSRPLGRAWLSRIPRSGSRAGAEREGGRDGGAGGGGEVPSALCPVAPAPIGHGESGRVRPARWLRSSSEERVGEQPTAKKARRLRGTVSCCLGAGPNHSAQIVSRPTASPPPPPPSSLLLSPLIPAEVSKPVATQATCCWAREREGFPTAHRRVRNLHLQRCLGMLGESFCLLFLSETMHGHWPTRSARRGRMAIRSRGG